ncbi:sigma-70 family RNA polymerase sigma factor [Mucilaginibacter sp. CSA2-8R]|uniref:RNA polymerase sigma factor n=1 Tax=Mucilaginibacter sp. CSA2-8R TaxID=3141542 RepID=UPI00315D6825
MKHFSDAALLQQIKQDDHLAFDELFERYWEKMFKAAWSRLSDEAAAQDVVQEIFIKIWQRRQVLEIHISLEYYLLSAVRLSVIDYFRLQKVSRQRMEDALQRIEILEDSIHANAGYLELEHTLAEAVSHMPEMLQRIYELRSSNHSVKAIAVKLGLAEQTVKNYISEVLRRLRIVVNKNHPEKNTAYLAIALLMLYN